MKYLEHWLDVKFVIEMFCKFVYFFFPLYVFRLSGKLVTVLIDETTRTKTFSHDLCLYDDTLVVPRHDKSVVIYEITY